MKHLIELSAICFQQRKPLFVPTNPVSASAYPDEGIDWRITWLESAG
jgi:hypothetical protein